MTDRLFISLKLPVEILQEIEFHKEKANPAPARFRWEGREKLHLTIKFLGDVEEERIADILSALEQAASKCGKIRLKFGKFDFLYRFDTPQLLWLELKAFEELQLLVNSIEEAFGLLGFEREKRKFRAHVTLLRIKEKVGNNFIRAFTDYKMPEREFYCQEISLVKSKLQSGGSIYTEIKKFNLI